MRSIDIHAHYFAQGLLRAGAAGKEWHGMKLERDARGRDVVVVGSRRSGQAPKRRWTLEERMQEMDSLGTDVHVLSAATYFYNYEIPANLCIASSREINNELSDAAKTYPTRYSGLATLPMQDIPAAIAELERAVGKLGLKGAMIGDNVNGRWYDEPEFLPFFKAADQAGALILFHQLAGVPVVDRRTRRYHLGNTIGNLVQRSMAYASLVFGGVMDACPNLQVCLCHGGGYVCFGVGRMDRGWEVRPEARVHIKQPPSKYLRRFHYDCLVYTEEALRFLVDTVGADRVVFGTDWPADMELDWPVAWILKMDSLTQEEKELILWKNLERLLRI
ncbi:MAG: Amidohydrolase [Dehalococcoidia bacterium]|nr:Amidohydrolase [Dehalococcoidia bacterium]